MENPDQYSTGGSQSSEASSSAEAIAKTEEQIVKAILSEWYPSFKKDEIAIWADDAMEDAAELSGKVFGSIISEEDAMEKAQAVWIELGWQGDIENIKKDKKKYKAEFFNEYGVWMVDSFYQQYDAVSPSSYDVVPGSGYCAIMRKSDGKVFAAWLS